MTPSADRLLACIAALFGEDATARVFHPLVADWQHEMRHAGPGLPRLRSAITGTFALGSAALCTAVAMAAPWSADRGSRVRSARVFITFAIAGSTILIVPFTRYLEHPVRGSLLLIALLPSSLAVSLSFASLPAAMVCAGTAHTAIARHRLYVIGGVALVVLILVGLVGWGAPGANQLWRAAVVGHPIARGIRELTLPELWMPAGGPVMLPAELASELRTRAALMFAWPAALAILGWRIGRHRLRVSTAAMTFWWAIAALVVGIGDPIRHVARELSYQLLPCVWLVIAIFLRPRADATTPPSFSR